MLESQRLPRQRRRRHDEADRRCVIIEPIDENLEELGALFRPLADGMTDLWSTFSDDELDVIIRYVQQSNALVAAVNARLRARDPE